MLNEGNNLSVYREKMEKSLTVLNNDFQTIRAGRANPRLLDTITVSYYGVETPLSQVANIQVPEARLLMVTPWDQTLLKDIERSIQASDLGINPMNDGKCLRLAFPPLTEDRRRDLTRTVAQMGESTKVALRNIRREAIDEHKKLLKDKEISENAYYVVEDEVQKMTDKFITKVDEVVEEKNKELMEI